jgi:hypothetical protein
MILHVLLVRLADGLGRWLASVMPAHDEDTCLLEVRRHGH